jgi:hypothetical protein
MATVSQSFFTSLIFQAHLYHAHRRWLHVIPLISLRRHDIAWDMFYHDLPALRPRSLPALHLPDQLHSPIGSMVQDALPKLVSRRQNGGKPIAIPLDLQLDELLGIPKRFRPVLHEIALVYVADLHAQLDLGLVVVRHLGQNGSGHRALHLLEGRVGIFRRQLKCCIRNGRQLCPVDAWHPWDCKMRGTKTYLK